MWSLGPLWECLICLCGRDKWVLSCVCVCVWTEWELFCVSFRIYVCPQRGGFWVFLSLRVGVYMSVHLEARACLLKGGEEPVCPPSWQSQSSPALGPGAVCYVSLSSEGL